MLTLKNFDKVLVSYLYEPDQFVAKVEYKENAADDGVEPVAVLETIKGKRKGVVVALGAGILGWSVCNTKQGWSAKTGWHDADVFDRSTGLSLALKRADIASGLNVVDRQSFYEKVPFSIIDLFEQMELRSELYFHKKDSSSEDDLPF